MAKKKKEEDENEEGGVAVKEKKKERRKVDELFVSANCLVNRKEMVIPISPSLDLICGGYKEGSLVVITGKFKLGKTSLALQMCANAQKKEYGGELCPNGRRIFIYNVEGRLQKRDLLGINGLDIDKVDIIESKIGEILYAEDYIERCERLINEFPGSVHLMDSFSSLLSKGEAESDYNDRYRADSPLLIARFCRRISNILPITRSVLIGVTHIIANSGARPGQSPYSESSGNKLQYAMDLKLHAKWAEKYEIGGTQIGQKVHWVCNASPITSPGMECVSLLRYGYGLDIELETLMLAVDFGIIDKGGAGWMTLPNGEKVQGLENARNKLLDNKEMYSEINTKVRTMLGLESVCQ